MVVHLPGWLDWELGYGRQCCIDASAGSSGFGGKSEPRSLLSSTRCRRLVLSWPERLRPSSSSHRLQRSDRARFVCSCHVGVRASSWASPGICTALESVMGLHISFSCPAQQACGMPSCITACISAFVCRRSPATQFLVRHSCLYLKVRRPNEGDLLSLSVSILASASHERVGAASTPAAQSIFSPYRAL